MPRFDELLRDCCWALCVLTGAGALVEVLVLLAVLAARL
jgi:hypothetical protein